MIYFVIYINENDDKVTAAFENFDIAYELANEMKGELYKATLIIDNTEELCIKSSEQPKMSEN